VAMRVALITPNVSKRPNNTNRLYSIGLLYLAAAVREAGFEPYVYDAYFSNKDASETTSFIVDAGRPDVIGFMINNEEMLSEAIEAYRLVSSAEYSMTPRLILGGHYASTHAEAILKRYAEVSAVVVGEGENTLKALLRDLANGGEIQPRKGLLLQDAATVEQQTACRSPLELSLDNLPGISWRDLHEKPQTNEWSLVTSRGCSAACSFCVIGPHWSRYRQWRGHSAEWVVCNIQRLVDEEGCSYLQFVDDQFVGTPDSVKRAHRIVELMKIRKLSVPFYIMVRADVVVQHPDLFRALRSVGLDTVFIGMESAQPETLIALNKECTVETSSKAFAILAEMDVKVTVGTILFTPWSTRSGILEEIIYLEEQMNLYPHFFFYGLNELDVIARTPLSKRIAGDMKDGLKQWQFNDTDVAGIYRQWRQFEDILLFPLMTSIGIANKREARRRVCRWQLKCLRSLIERKTLNWTTCYAEAISLLTGLNSTSALSDFVGQVSMEKITHLATDYDGPTKPAAERERCFL